MQIHTYIKLMSVVYVILNIFDKATPQQKKIPKTKPGYKSIVN